MTPLTQPPLLNINHTAIGGTPAAQEGFSYDAIGNTVEVPTGDETLDERRYCLKDDLDVVALCDEAGTVTERFAYSAFGQVTFLDAAFAAQPSSASGWNLLFHAEFVDAETGWMDYGFRYYSIELGRWLSRDPLKEAAGPNLYAFVYNSPINLYDEFGLDWIDSRLNAMPASWVDKIAGMPEIPQGVVNFSAGVGDHLSFDLTDIVREAMETNDFVVKDSGSYTAGTAAGGALDVAITGGSMALTKSASKISASQLAKDRTVLRKALKLGKGAKNSKGQKLYAHHKNPLKGHPGGKSTMFPTAGLPSAIKSSRLNGKALTHAKHMAAHRRTQRAERAARALGFGNPVIGAARTGLSALRTNSTGSINGNDCS